MSDDKPRKTGKSLQRALSIFFILLTLAAGAALTVTAWWRWPLLMVGLTLLFLWGFHRRPR
jgi:hypothetical protein